MDVDSLVRAFRPPEDEVAVHRRFLALLDSPHPASRRQFDPGHFTASGFVLSPDRTALLLVLHRRLGRWLQPGGHIDPGDASAEEAARREIAEETGVSAMRPVVAGLFGLDDHAIPPRHDEPAHRHYDLEFAFVAADVDLVPSAEVAGVAWVPLEDVTRVSDDAATGRAVTRLRSRP